jgi:hypothetical protein
MAALERRLQGVQRFGMSVLPFARWISPSFTTGSATA